MPLTNSGKKVLRNFKKEYGSIEGEKRFYAYMNNFPKRVKSWHN